MKNAFSPKKPNQRDKMNALSIFEKHLGSSLGVDSQKSIAKNIKDINQAIGSLQTIDSTLKKALNHLDDFNSFASSCECSFMGENLINKEITLLLFGELKSFFIQDFSTLTSNTQEELEDYFKQKREEISSILDWVMDGMEQTPVSNSFTPSSHYSYQQDFYKF